MTITIEPAIKDGIPTHLRCYDNKGESYDRYTVVFTELDWCPFMSMSDNPSHPTGFCVHDSSTEPIDKPSHAHLGEKVSFESLPEEVRKCVIQTYKDLWNLEES